MVRYTGRAKTRTGSVNTNQLGLKMSGCTSRIGRTMVPMKLVPSRVDCMAGVCKPIRYHGVLWGRGGLRNQPPYCRRQATRCQAAAGGVGTKHNIPYYRIPKRGESGCTPAPVDRSTVFQLTAVGYGGPPSYPFVGYAAAGFVEDGAPAVGDLQPRQYAGRTIVMLSACLGGPSGPPPGTTLGVLFTGREEVAFNTLRFMGEGVNLTFHRAQARNLPADDEWVERGYRWTNWCYPSGSPPGGSDLDICPPAALPPPGTYTVIIS